MIHHHSIRRSELFDPAMVSTDFDSTIVVDDEGKAKAYLYQGNREQSKSSYISRYFSPGERHLLDSTLIIDCHVSDDCQIRICAGNDKQRSFNINIFRSGGKHVIPTDLLGLKGLELIELVLVSTQGITISSLYISDDKSDEISPRFKINFNSGIGDCLRAISRHADLDALLRNTNASILWTYGACDLKDSGWTDLLREQVFGRVKRFEYATPAEFSNSDAVEIFNGYSGKAMLNGIFESGAQGLEIRLTDSEDLFNKTLIASASRPLIGIQLEGNDERKTWGKDKHLKLCLMILEEYPSATIIILDAPNRIFSCESHLTRIINLIGITSLSQNIDLIRKVDLWIAPDSFSKYVRNWAKQKQILLCHRLPYLEPKEMLEHCFANVGLCNNPDVEIIGIEYGPDLTVTDGVDHMNDITVDQVMDKVRKSLSAPWTCFNMIGQGDSGHPIPEKQSSTRATRALDMDFVAYSKETHKAKESHPWWRWACVADHNDDTRRHHELLKNGISTIANLKISKCLSVGDSRARDAAYAKHCFNCFSVASDLSSECIKPAVGEGFVDKVDDIDVENIQYPDNSFDMVLAKETFHHWPRPMLGFYEMIRVASKVVLLIEPSDLFFGNEVTSFVEEGQYSDRYEEVGNYVYQLSLREVLKAAWAMQLPGVIARGLNDPYDASNTDFLSWLRRKEDLDKLGGEGVRRFDLMAVAVFKEKASFDEASSDLPKFSKCFRCPVNPFPTEI